MTGMSMAMLVDVVGTFCHLYNRRKAQTPALKYAASRVLSAPLTRHTLLGIALRPQTRFPAQSTGQMAASTHAASRVLWLPPTDIPSWA